LVTACLVIFIVAFMVYFKYPRKRGQ